MSDTQVSSTAAEAEAKFLEQAAEVFEKSASAAPAPSEFIADDASRFEEKKPEEEEQEEIQATTTKTKWGSSPSMRNQMVEHPDSIRFSDPETKILRLSDTKDLEEWNRIQREEARHESPTLVVTEKEKIAHEGSWVIYVTVCNIEYAQF